MLIGNTPGLMVKLVPDGKLERPSRMSMLMDRLEQLNDQDTMTPAMRLESWAISRLLSRRTITSGELLRFLLKRAGLGADFPVTHEYAHILKPLIEYQRTVWDNLVDMVVGKQPRPFTPLDVAIPNLEYQAGIALDWWVDVVRALARMIELNILTPDAILNELPPSVRRAQTRQLLEGPYVLGYTLYQQQCSQGGVRQSIDHNAVVALADTLASAVTAANTQVNALVKSGGQRYFLERRATHLAWLLAILHGFVVAAIDDPDRQLQAALLDHQAVLDGVNMALCARPAHPGTISWAGSSANPLNVEIQSKVTDCLLSRFGESVQKAAESPLRRIRR